MTLFAGLSREIGKNIAKHPEMAIIPDGGLIKTPLAGSYYPKGYNSLLNGDS